MRELKMACTPVGYALLVGLCVAGSPATAQQAATPATQVPQHSEGVSQKPGPAGSSPEMQSLIKALSGRWTLSVKFEANAAMPNGSEGTGEETWQSGPGGFTLLEEERIPTPGGDAYLLGVIWWDGQTGSLHGMECNNQLPTGCDPKGSVNDITVKWDGKAFSINEWETHGGKRTLWHEVWSDITPTSFTQTGVSEDQAGGTTKIFTMHGTRTGGIQ